MDGDLSLSQSLGGLRIANPDDLPEDVAASHSRNELAPSGRPNPSTSTLSLTSSIPPFAEDPHNTPVYKTPDYNPSVDSRPPPAVHPHQDLPPQQPQSPPPLSPQQQAPQFPPNPSLQYLPYPNPARPLALNGSLNPPHTREQPYRIRTGSTTSNESQAARAEIRSGSSALQAGVQARDDSHSDRSYAAAHPPAHPPPILRQHSRTRPRARSGEAPSQHGSPYALENGPPASSDNWQERGAAVTVRQEYDTNGKPVTRYIKKGVRDFSFGQTLGEGSYSTVIFATDRQTLKEYAIKVLDKRHIIKEKKVKYVNIEKDTLNRLTEHPGIVRLYYTFQDERSLYFVLDFCKGGELLSVLKRMTTFDEECTKFYAAQILDTVDYMHKRGVIHRDLKPENVLLDSQMHVKITDFGTAKILNAKKRLDEGTTGMPPMDDAEQERASSFVGTAEYVSPELLTEKNACKASDLWAFGCIIYQLLAGRPPFKAGNEYQTFQKIVALNYEFPLGFPAVARDLVERLLVLDPAMRLPIEHIKNHEFFRGVAWGPDMWKRKAPRLKAYVPPPREPIKLNGGSDVNYAPNASTAALTTNSSNSRVLPRIITELPPPSQLDVEWSPVLTKSNERILKLGNVAVIASSPSHNPSKNGGGESETSRKFSRFFVGTTKRRQRLAMVTSSARIIVTAANGDEKKAKFEISLLAPGIQYHTATDLKGFTSWVVETKEKHFVFEDPKPSSAIPGATALTAREWLDSLDLAREIALSQHHHPSDVSSDSGLRDMPSTSRHNSTSNQFSEAKDARSETPHRGGATLVKQQPSDSDSVRGRKRFSRRHSKNGLSAVF